MVDVIADPSYSTDPATNMPEQQAPDVFDPKAFIDTQPLQSVTLEEQVRLSKEDLRLKAEGKTVYTDHPENQLPLIEKMMEEPLSAKEKIFGKKDNIAIQKGNIARFYILTPEGFIRVPSQDKPFTIIRYLEGGQRVSVAVFKVALQKKFGKHYTIREVPFNDKLAIPTSRDNWEAQFDVTTYLQIVVSHDRAIQHRMLNIEQEFTRQMESINAVAVVKKDFLAKKKPWWQLHPELLFMVGAMFVWAIFMLGGMYFLMQNFTASQAAAGSTFLTKWGTLASKLLGGGISP